MTEKKAFKLMADAIYDMHRFLKEIKRVSKTAENLVDKETKKEIVLAYADRMEAALKRAGQGAGEWLSKIRENPPP